MMNDMHIVEISQVSLKIDHVKSLYESFCWVLTMFLSSIDSLKSVKPEPIDIIFVSGSGILSNSSCAARLSHFPLLKSKYV